ncbi:MAG: DUF4352 domain-containing protein [Clostridiales bacterium]|nr:DUF4352 domain-containing protein [Clostridiales bacterium]
MKDTNEAKQVKNCKYCQSEIAKKAKVCPNCGRKQRGIGKWVFLVVILIIILLIAACSSGNSENSTSKIGMVDDITETNLSSASSENDAVGADEEAQTEYYVGDILQDGDMKIVYMASGVYTEDNEFSQPDEGCEYIFLEFAFENTSASDDAGISFYSFECYADGYNVDMYYGGEEDLSATLSAGRSTIGYIYFEVPEDAEAIEVEYTTNYFTSDKITFIYDGEQDSGYEIETDTTPTEGAFSVGDIIEAGDISITYLDCYVDTSNSAYSEPKEGYHYITCEFEFENNGGDDEYVSYYDFDCFADALSCEMAYFRDDGLSATISSGHKAKGTVTFEVPDDATVIECEYLTNYWTSSRIVFSCVS